MRLNKWESNILINARSKKTVICWILPLDAEGRPLLFKIYRFCLIRKIVIKFSLSGPG